MVQKKVQMHKAKLGLKYLYIRKNVYIYRRPIPSRFHILADQTEFKSSLKTRIENTALQAYADADEYYDWLFDRMANQLRRQPRLWRGWLFSVRGLIRPARDVLAMCSAGSTKIIPFGSFSGFLTDFAVKSSR